MKLWSRKKIGLTLLRNEDHADITYPYTIAVLSAWIKKTQPKTRVFYSEDTSELLKADEVWCSAASEVWNEVNQLGKIITAAGKRFLVGGHHVSALPETLKYGEAFIGAIEGQAYCINDLPLPDLSILPFKRKKEKLLVLMTSRGCPFKCTFCSSSAFWKKYVPKSPERVIEELKQLYKLKVKTVNIFDDLFTADKKRLKEIVAQVKAEGLDKIAYSCLVRADTINSEVMDLLMSMNVRSIAFGSESGSNNILKLMNKRSTVDDNINAVNIIKGYGIKVAATSIIIGHPGESPSTLLETKEYIERIRPYCSNIAVFPLIPFPGTPLWDIFCKKYNINIYNFDWSSLKIYEKYFSWSKYSLLSDDCSIDDLKNLYDFNVNLQYQSEQPTLTA